MFKQQIYRYNLVFHPSVMLIYTIYTNTYGLLRFCKLHVPARAKSRVLCDEFHLITIRCLEQTPWTDDKYWK